jgi:hypothetical protein
VFAVVNALVYNEHASMKAWSEDAHVGALRSPVLLLLILPPIYYTACLYCLQYAYTACNLQMLSSRTGQPLAQLNLTKSASWQPDPAAAVQLFNRTAAVPDPSGIDSSALQQLLQQDLLAAAAAANPAKLADSLGPGSKLAEIMSSLPVGGAPTPVRTQMVTS